MQQAAEPSPCALYRHALFHAARCRFDGRPFVDSEMPGYDEKVDIWKVRQASPLPPGKPRLITLHWMPQVFTPPHTHIRTHL